MLGPVKRMVPAPVKRSLKSSVSAVVGRSDLAVRVQDLAGAVAGLRDDHDRLVRSSTDTDLGRRVDELREAVDLLRAWVFELQPDVLAPSESARRVLADLLARHGVDAARLDMGVSKNDVMFQYLAREFVRRGRGIDWAYVKYVFSGLHMFQVLDAFAVRKFGALRAVPALLDFASGYGRLTRHLVLALDPVRVWVSDIKDKAVAFQRRRFGVHGFPSTAEPDDLAVTERFDLIFVGSLFSHLPEGAFGRWLGRLWDLLTPTGLLVFSVHDASLIDAGGAFTFRPVSEEGAAPTTDGTLDPAKYGNAYVTESFVRKAIDRHLSAAGPCARYPLGLWNLQDVYALARDGSDFCGLSLPRPLV